MAVNYTPISTGEAANASTFNSRLQELDDIVEDLRDGTATMDSPTISSMVNAQHDHESAAGGGVLDPTAALDSSGQSEGDLLGADGAGGMAFFGSPTIPTGAVMDYAGSSAPSGWLLCDGSAVSRATYAGLFGVISTTYGVGDGSTTFNLPDLRGRILAAKDNMGGSSANRIVDAQADVLGGVMGAETVTLTTTEMPTHSHTISSKNDNGGTYASHYVLGRVTDNVQGNETDLITAANAGSGGAHANVQPTLFMNKIIKA